MSFTEILYIIYIYINAWLLTVAASQRNPALAFSKPKVPGLKFPSIGFSRESVLLFLAVEGEGPGRQQWVDLR